MKWLVAMVFVCGCSMMVEEEVTQDAGASDSGSDTNGSDVSSVNGSDSQTTEQNNSTGTQSEDTQMGTGSENNGTETELVPDCKNGEVRCVGFTTVTTCNELGEWVVTEECIEGNACINGQCACSPSPTGIKVCEDNKLYNKMSCGENQLIKDCGFDGNTCMKKGSNDCFYDEINDPFKECNLNINTFSRFHCYTKLSGFEALLAYRKQSDGPWQSFIIADCANGCNQIDLCTAECY